MPLVATMRMAISNCAIFVQIYYRNQESGQRTSKKERLQPVFSNNINPPDLVTLSQDVIEHFGNRVRVRACGLCTQGTRLLLVNHAGLGQPSFWAPPGGGVELHERVTDALVREFREETGLRITPGKFLFACELVKPPLHAIELFFQVEIISGTLAQGHDPELHRENQLIQEIAFKDWSDINRMPPEAKHGILHLCNSVEDLSKLAGFYRI